MGLKEILEMSHIETSDVNGELVITIKDFAYLTKRTTMSIYALIEKGNRLRKLRVVRVCGVAFIPLKEFTEYPFTSVRRDEVIYFNEDGTERKLRMTEAKNG